MSAVDELRDDMVKAAAAKDVTTYKQMAKLLCITPQYLTDIMKGRRRFTPDLVRKAEDVFSAHPVRGQRWQRLGAIASGWRIDVRDP